MSGTPAGTALEERETESRTVERADAPEAPRRTVLTIVGPTAVGKTSVALVVARLLGGEIVSADSRQIYRGMDIGTAKPTRQEQAAVRHHLIDIVDPCERYDAARFASDAEAVIASLLTAGIEPVVVGGTGFYLASLYEGLFEGPERDESVRTDLERRLAAEGPSALHAELSRVDPAAAERIHPRDASRIVRALELYEATGRTLSEWHAGSRRAPAFAPRYVGLALSRRALRERIGLRVKSMMATGLAREVASLRAEGRLLPGMPAASAVGYREILELGDAPDAAGLAGAAERITTSTRRYAKRQLTWFRSLPAVRWLDVETLGVQGAAAEVARLARPETP
jgi:tRNA dimethylallyltransferase